MDPNKEVQLLRRQLKGFMDQAAENAAKAQRFQSLELKLIGSGSLGELIDAVVDDYQAAFGLDVITLALLDPEYEIRRMLEASRKQIRSLHRLIFLISKEDSHALDALSLFPRLGAYNRKKHTWLFPSMFPRPKSIALLPLVGHGRIIGSLNLGSRCRDRFAQGLGADFLERLAAIASLSFENSINHERLKMLGLTDPLTGVNNRRFFEQRLREEVIRAERSKQSLSCLFFDVDRFKSVNDRFGHRSGDIVLREIASILTRQMRLSDVLVRYGGEEFASLLVDTRYEAAIDIAERIRQAVSAHRFDTPEGDSLRVTISIGVATLCQFNYGVDSKAGERLIHDADMALLDAKQRGRNTVVAAKMMPTPIFNRNQA